MCGRFTLTVDPEELVDALELAEPPRGLEPHYNIAPTQSVFVLTAETPRILLPMRWGLVPWWAKDFSMGARTINARRETLDSKPAFRDALRERRCIIPASGFYEWKRAGARKTPMYIRRRDGELLLFAGLWERWRPKEGEPVLSCTIVTGEPNALVAPIHDRMPVILDAAGAKAWLTPGPPSVEGLPSLLATAPAEPFEAYEVSTRVNSVANDDPECIAPSRQMTLI